MSADVRSIRFFSRRDAINVLAFSGIALFPFSKPASARKPDGDGLFEKISAQTGALDSVVALIDEEKWKDARKKAKDIDVALRSGVIMPLSRSVGRKVKGIVEMQTILFEDFVELEKCLRSQNAVGAKAQVDRVRATVSQLLGMEESILKFFDFLEQLAISSASGSGPDDVASLQAASLVICLRGQKIVDIERSTPILRPQRCQIHE
eukprot:CAMPEP_0172176202 /NCGR_PEP_ID=MMETSP1050-20130122/14663_1 /TAXON_ID=233186 /ORGANISM="Cryptomonas curvata, Strain CCAP979/52" /LENGTH=206 /DNA_ID=CAMNT_0012848411 /DNA_START=130 /DNA_END=751 /DNA_ORIENTATION=-